MRRGVDGCPRVEHAELVQRSHFGLVEQVPAPLDRVLERGPARVAQYSEPFGQRLEDLGGGQDRGPRRCQLDRERETVERTAQAGHRLPPGLGWKVGAVPLRAIEEQLDAGAGRPGRERIDLDDPLGSDPEPLARRHDDSAGRAGDGDRVDEIGHPVHDLLAVVEHEQGVAGADVVEQRIGRRGTGLDGDLERCHDRRHGAVGVENR